MISCLYSHNKEGNKIRHLFMIAKGLAIKNHGDHP